MFRPVQVEEDLMDKMVVEADCIPGGIDGEATLGKTQARALGADFWRVERGEWSFVSTWR